MRRIILFTTIISICIYAFFASGVFSSLALFLTLGMVPGTDYMVSPEYLAGIYTAIVALLIVRGALLAGRSLIRVLRRSPAQKKPLARRRYSRTSVV